MVNLLGRGNGFEGWVCLEAESGGRVEARIAGLAALVRRQRFVAEGPTFGSLDGDLEELAASPSRITALALLEAIDEVRQGRGGGLSAGVGDRARDGVESAKVRPEVGSAAMGAGPSTEPTAPLAGGEWLLHRLGRSLATGEAEIASRGYFDVEDRPPIGTWIALIAPAAGGAGRASGDDALAIAAWVGARDVERARAGRLACPSGAIAWLSEQSPEIHARLRAIEERASRLQVFGRDAR